MYKSFLLSSLLLVINLGSVHDLRAQSFQGLGFLDIETSQAMGVSADGNIVVGIGSTPLGVGFRWENGVMVNLGTGHLDRGTQAGVVSGDGSIIAGWSFETNSRLQPAHWVDQVFGLLTLPEGDFERGRVHGISVDGTQIVGEFYTSNYPGISGILWKDGAPTVLPDFDGSTQTIAWDISGDGSLIVGERTTGSGATKAIKAQFWHHRFGKVEAPINIHPEGWDQSTAKAISADGTVIVGNVSRVVDGVFEQRPFRYEGGILTVLADLPGGESWADIKDVSTDGKKIVGRTNSAGIIWDEENGWREVFSVVQDLGLDTMGWTSINTAEAISDNGFFIVGSGINASGVFEAYRTELLPEPETDIIVNDTRDLEDADNMDGVCDVDTDQEENQCTLRAAIQEANRRGGGSITFAIEGEGVPQIVVDLQAEGMPSSLPTVQFPTTIDGVTQPGGWVELTGGPQGKPHDQIWLTGLRIGDGATGSIIRGMIINKFEEVGVELAGNNCIIESNRIGTDAIGLTWRGNGDQNAGFRVYSSGNAIRNNILAGNVQILEGGGVFRGLEMQIFGDNNIVQGNRFGVGEDGRVIELPDWEVSPQGSYGATGGLVLHGNGNLIGGVGPGVSPGNCTHPCNLFAGHKVEITSSGFSTLGAAGVKNQIIGNVFGVDAFGDPYYPREHPDPTNEPSIGIAFEGTETEINGNHITNEYEAVNIFGINETLMGNTIRITDEALHETASYKAVSISGESQRVLENDIQGRATIGMAVAGIENTISDNVIYDNTFGGILVDEGTKISISGNDIRDNRLGGIMVPDPSIGEPSTVRISENKIYRNDIGIDLGGLRTNVQIGDGVTINDALDFDDGPNGLQNYPNVTALVQNGSMITLEGFVETPLTSLEPYKIEVFSTGACSHHELGMQNVWAHGQGEQFLTSFESTAHLGDASFNAVLEGELPPGHRFITLTATHISAGTTSEFSRCLEVVPENRFAKAEIAEQQTGEVLAANGLVITTSLSTGKTAHNSGTLYTTRYDVSPAINLFSGATAIMPSGNEVEPAHVASNYWSLTDRGLTVAGGAENDAYLFEVCLDPTDLVKPENLAEVVLVQRNDSTAGVWEPFDSYIREHDIASYVCASGITSLGEFGIGGLEDAFPVGVEEEDVEAPDLASFTLSPGYPNPFGTSVNFELAVATPGPARVEVFDLLGRRVSVLQEGEVRAGRHTLQFNGRGLPSGQYIVQAYFDNTMASQMVTLLR